MTRTTLGRHGTGDRTRPSPRSIAREALMRLWSAPRFGIISHGPGCRIANSCNIRRGLVRMGRRVFLGPQCFIQLPMAIGDNVMLAARVAVVGGNHRFDVVGVPMIDTGRASYDTVTIGDDVWIGHGAIIVGGRTIGTGSIVAAGSVVTRDVPPLSVVAGVPGRVIRPRFAEPAAQEAHMRALLETKLTLGVGRDVGP